MTQDAIDLPPPIVLANQSRVTHHDRRRESTSISPHPGNTSRDLRRGGGRRMSLGASRSRGRCEDGSDRDVDDDEEEEWTTSTIPTSSDSRRDRSESRDGRTSSRVPLFRRESRGHHYDYYGNERSRERGDLEKNQGRNWEEARDDQGKLSSSSSEPNLLKNLARHFIGVRDKHSIESPLLRPLRYLSQVHENYLLAFFGAFVAILGAGGISFAFKNVQGFEGDTPLAIGSLGATAVLLYVVPESPLSQPRSVIGGHMVSALSGVIISQLFALNSRFADPLSEDNTVVQQNSWYHLTPVAYALAVAIAIFGMQITKTVHPPGGATALIASAHRTVDGRYTYILDIFLAVTWMTLWSFFVNNLGRRKYPMFWWTPKQPPPSSASKIEEKEINILPMTNPPPLTGEAATAAAPPQLFETSSKQKKKRRLGNLDEEETTTTGATPTPTTMASVDQSSVEESVRGRQKAL